MPGCSKSVFWIVEMHTLMQKKNLNEKCFFILKIFDFENFDFLKKNLIFQKSKISIEKSIFSSKIFTWKNRFFNWNFRFLKNQIFFQKIKIFKMKNLQDEKIFFIQIFFCIKVCISTIQKTYLEHPGMCLEVGAAVLAIHQRKLIKLANFAISSLKNEAESWFGMGAQSANDFFSEVWC